MQGRVTKVINMKPPELLGLIEEAAGISLYQTKKEQTLALIKKKDNKIIEIDKILSEEVNPQLDALRKEKDDFALFKSNEGHMEENDKLLIAYDYFENDRFLSSSDDKQKEIVDKIRRINQDIVVINDELEQLKRVIQKIQSGASNNERDI